MLRLHLLKHDQQIDIIVDKQIDPSDLLIAATYRQLALASKCVLTIYDLSLILVDGPFNSSYDTVTTPSPILALTATIDRLIYVHRSVDNPNELLIRSIPSQAQEQSLIIEACDATEKIRVCSLDDGTIYLAYNSKILSLTRDHWSFDSKIVKLSSGKEHVLVLLADGRVFTWGNGLHGALGLGDLEPCPQPAHVDALSSEVIDIAAGGWHSLGRVQQKESLDYVALSSSAFC